MRFDFNLDLDATVDITTYSFAGGAMADGTVVSHGGFDTDIVLYNATNGAFIAYDDDSSLVSNPANGHFLSWDSFMSNSLSAGNYSLFLGVYQTSYGVNINDPRSSDATDFGLNFDPNTDIDVPRTGSYAIEFVANNANLTGGNAVSLPNGVAAVPEPETYAMFLAGLGLLGFVSSRKKA